jgi:hypothetical protein
MLKGQTITERVMRRLLREANDFKKIEGFAVFMTKTDKGYDTAVIYDTNYVKQCDKENREEGKKPIWKKPDTVLGTRLIKGLISIKKPDGPCWGASEVKFVAGNGGILFPLGYDMSPSGRLIMDKEPGKVSDDARNSWTRAFKDGVVEPLRLDDIEHRGKHHHTEDPQDDCALTGPDTEDNALNYAFQGSGKGFMAQLKAAHQNVLNEIPQENQAEFIGALERGTVFFWDNTYGN